MNKLCGILCAACICIVAIQGCDDVTLPAGTVGIVDTLDVPVNRTLEADQIYPTEGAVGSEITVFGRGETFPTGFYRVTFTGGASYEFFQERATGNLVIEIPTGARSGPFGFIIGSRPNSGHDIAGAGSDGFMTYTVRDPGIRVVGQDPWVPTW